MHCIHVIQITVGSIFAPFTVTTFLPRCSGVALQVVEAVKSFSFLSPVRP
jgi:hypothetical protein